MTTPGEQPHSVVDMDDDELAERAAVRRDIGRRVRELREAKGWTRRKLRTVAGVYATDQGLKQVEDGASQPLTSQLTAIARALETTPDYLVTGKQPDEGSLVDEWISRMPGHPPVEIADMARSLWKTAEMLASNEHRDRESEVPAAPTQSRIRADAPQHKKKRADKQRD